MKMNSAHKKLMITQGTHICLLVAHEDGIETGHPTPIFTSTTTTTTAVAVHIRSLLQVYDTCVPIANIGSYTFPDNSDENESDIVTLTSNLKFEERIIHVRRGSGSETESSSEVNAIGGGINFIQDVIHGHRSFVAKGSGGGSGSSARVNDDDTVQVCVHNMPSHNDDGDDDDGKGKSKGEKCYTLTVRNDESLHEKNVVRIDNQDSGYLIADFVGINGYEQILFLPPSSSSLSSTVANANSGTATDKDNHEDMLRKILLHSVLTDGVSIMFHSCNKINVQKDTCNSSLAEGNSLLRIHLPMVDNSSIPLSTSNQGSSEPDMDIQLTSRSKRRKRGNIDAHEHETDQFLKSSENISGGGSMNGSSDAGIGSGSVEPGRESESEWQKKLRVGIKKRYERELSLLRKQRNIRQIKQSLILHSKNVLKELSLTSADKNIATVTRSQNHSIQQPQQQCHMNQKAPDLKMVRFRHVLEPMSSFFSTNDGKLSACMQIEVDLMVPPIGNTDNADGMNRIKNLVDHNLYDVQLSCSQQSKLEDTTVQTRSAVVPAFPVGACFTIMAKVTISGIKLPSRIHHNSHHAKSNVQSQSQSDARQSSKEEEECHQYIKLSLNAHFRTTPNIPHGTKMDMRGIVLGHLTVPLASMILSRDVSIGKKNAIVSSSSSPSSLPMTTMDFSKVIIGDGDGDATTNHNLVASSSSLNANGNDNNRNDDDDDNNPFHPLAIFDYRPPEILTIDISNHHFRAAVASSSSASSTNATSTTPMNIRNEWKLILDSINDACARGNRVDFHYEDGDNDGDDEKTTFAASKVKVVKLAIFAESPEQRAYLREMVKIYIPDWAKMTTGDTKSASTSTMKPSYLTRSLLESQRKELNFLANCTNSNSKKAFTQKDLKELVLAQNLTDEVAARILDAKEN